MKIDKGNAASPPMVERGPRWLPFPAIKRHSRPIRLTSNFKDVIGDIDSQGSGRVSFRIILDREGVSLDSMSQAWAVSPHVIGDIEVQGPETSHFVTFWDILRHDRRVGNAPLQAISRHSAAAATRSATTPQNMKKHEIL